MNESFYMEEGEGAFMWTIKDSSIRFLIADNLCGSSKVHIQVIGKTIVGRPVQVALNGHRLRSLTPGRSRVTDFFAANDADRSGAENEISFSVENAGGPPATILAIWDFDWNRLNSKRTPQD